MPRKLVKRPPFWKIRKRARWEQLCGTAKLALIDEDFGRRVHSARNQRVIGKKLKGVVGA